MGIFKETDRYKICSYDLNMEKDNSITIGYYIKNSEGKYDKLDKKQITIPNSKDLTEEEIDSIISNAIYFGIDDHNLEPASLINNLGSISGSFSDQIAYFILLDGNLIHEFLISDRASNFIKIKALEAARDFEYIYDFKIMHDIIDLFKNNNDHIIRMSILDICHDSSFILKEISTSNVTSEIKDHRVLATLAKYVPSFVYEDKEGKRDLDDLALLYKENEYLFDINILINHILNFGVDEDFEYYIDLCYTLPAQYCPYKLVAALCLKYKRAVEIFAECDVELYSCIALSLSKNRYSSEFYIENYRHWMFNTFYTNNETKTKEKLSFYLDFDFNEITTESTPLSEDLKNITILYKNEKNNYFAITHTDKVFNKIIDVYKNTVSAYSEYMINILTQARNRFLEQIGGQEVLDNIYAEYEKRINAPLEIDIT